ncbi:hypothetical protein H7J87_19195 [Mycolicibacterium wolinskyi]|uniref:Uncharacterized protein n=1 Tax=Mycolicibacterium wolinskyi TaxID=59750 RepID=A0A1X2ETW6_9MYCO|nr:MULTISPECIES: hypothetical protein [Mycolicibacterium]MCV7287452.1 hypothetical protein [Mycolicibacterium wolinskyi]MCV7294909.1 hypothetical protein [Mycolicibacterium goodii]ORX09259.1 hypothetical protein AWC31_09985 [Mycolicibacterium wolinskyi]
MTYPREELRALVREVVREAVAGLKTAPPARNEPAPPPPQTVAEQMGLEPTGPRAVDGRNRTEEVRLANDKDLDSFVRKLLRLFESPKSRADLKAGRLTFRLAGAPRTSGGPVTHRIESGAVTERHIADMAGGTLVLGRRAVLTPLAREKARALGITIEKERK